MPIPERYRQDTFAAQKIYERKFAFGKFRNEQPIAVSTKRKKTGKNLSFNIKGSRKSAERRFLGKRKSRLHRHCSFVKTKEQDQKPCSDVVETEGLEPATSCM